MLPKSPLDDPETAAYALARYIRLMRWMMLTMVTLVVGAIYLFYRSDGDKSVDLYIMIAMGVCFMMLVMAGLLGRAFFAKHKRDNRANNAPQDQDNS